MPRVSVPILNIAAYKFVHLDDLPAWRERLDDDALARGLKGTVLLAGEGINLCLAGPETAVRDWLQSLRADAAFADMEAKESWSAAVPFQRLRVKIKREIIRMDRPAVQPHTGRAPVIDAATLQRWLVQGHDDAARPVVLLDTRNAFEVDAGAFDRALDWRLTRFSDFPAALAANRAQLDGKTVVSYCTGGIRCEKAALLMQEAGLDSVYQLDGGVLRYFEQAPGAPHWRGHCFVFDERVALNPRLEAA
jgi:UPF0176 protein